MTSSDRSSLRSMLRWRGDLVRRCEDLERDVPLAQARDVDLAAIRRAAAGRGPRAVSRRGGRRPTASSWSAACTVRGGYGGGALVWHSRASVRPTIARPPALAASVTAVVAATAPRPTAAVRRRALTRARVGPAAVSGPRRGTPATGRRVRARHGRTPAGLPRSRARRRARGAAPRSPRCRVAGRP